MYKINKGVEIDLIGTVVTWGLKAYINKWMNDNPEKVDYIKQEVKGGIEALKEEIKDIQNIRKQRQEQIRRESMLPSTEKDRIIRERVFIVAKKRGLYNAWSELYEQWKLKPPGKEKDDIREQMDIIDAVKKDLVGDLDELFLPDLANYIGDKDRYQEQLVLIDIINDDDSSVESKKRALERLKDSLYRRPSFYDRYMNKYYADVISHLIK